MMLLTLPLEQWSSPLAPGSRGAQPDLNHLLPLSVSWSWQLLKIHPLGQWRLMAGNVSTALIRQTMELGVYKPTIAS